MKQSWLILSNLYLFNATVWSVTSKMTKWWNNVNIFYTLWWKNIPILLDCLVACPICAEIQLLIHGDFSPKCWQWTCHSSTMSQRVKYVCLCEFNDWPMLRIYLVGSNWGLFDIFLWGLKSEKSHFFTCEWNVNFLMYGQQFLTHTLKYYILH